MGKQDDIKATIGVAIATVIIIYVILGLVIAVASAIAIGFAIFCIIGTNYKDSQLPKCILKFCRSG